jgi:hypothetical protein
MRLREFTQPDKYFPPENDRPARPIQPESDRNDRPDDDATGGVARELDIRESQRRAGPIGFSRR